MRPTASLWIGTGLLAATFVAGCNQAQRQPARMTMTPTQTTQVYPTAKPQTTTVVTQLPEAQAPVEKPPEQLPAAAPAKAEPEMQPASYTAPVPKDEVKRRSFTDCSAKPGMGHADNYTWLTGELQYLHGANVWNLRYASVDEEDKFGGSVTLVEMGRQNTFQSGQMVRVEGEVLDPEAKPLGGQGYKFRVRSIEPLRP
jgi:hypothetical protein